MTSTWQLLLIVFKYNYHFIITLPLAVHALFHHVFCLFCSFFLSFKTVECYWICNITYMMKNSQLLYDYVISDLHKDYFIKTYITCQDLWLYCMKYVTALHNEIHILNFQISPENERCTQNDASNTSCNPFCLLVCSHLLCRLSHFPQGLLWKEHVILWGKGMLNLLFHFSSQHRGF